MLNLGRGTLGTKPNTHQPNSTPSHVAPLATTLTVVPVASASCSFLIVAENEGQGSWRPKAGFQFLFSTHCWHRRDADWCLVLSNNERHLMFCLLQS